MYGTLKRGVAAGALAGLAYGLFTWLVVNPLIAVMEGLAHEGHGHGHEHGHHAGEHAHAVSEATTAVVSAGGGVLWGILLGAAFGVAYFLLEPALPGGRAKPYALAGAGFLAVSGAPWLALPPTPPGADQLLSPGLRLAIYGGMMLLGALAAATALLAYDRLAPRRRSEALVAAAVPLAALVAVAAVVPANLGGGVPADLAAAFRWLVAFGQAGLWTLIAAAFVRLEGVFEGGTSTPVAAATD